MIKTEKDILHLREKIILLGENQEKEIIAKADTGAYSSSIDINLAAELHLGPIIKVKRVKSANGINRRAVVEATVLIKGKKITEEFTVSDRKDLRHAVLLGRKLLKKGNFLINPYPKKIK